MRLKGKQLDALNAAIKSGADAHAALQKKCEQLANVGQPLPETMWLIWSNEHDAWWGPNSCGYTKDRARAGHYTFAEALDIVSGANVHDCAHETMCPVWFTRKDG